MKPPRKYMQGKRVRYDGPDREWLEYQYATLGKSSGAIALEFGLSNWATFLSWLSKAGIPVRSTEERARAHSVRMAGTRNPAYSGGGSQKYQKRLLRKANPSEACMWCGGTENVQIHHIDHDRQNANLDNLMWLCNHCNLMEASLYHLTSAGRVTVHSDGDTLTIRFTKKEHGGAQ